MPSKIVPARERGANPVSIISGPLPSKQSSNATWTKYDLNVIPTKEDSHDVLVVRPGDHLLNDTDRKMVVPPMTDTATMMMPPMTLPKTFHDRVSLMGIISKTASESIGVSGLKYAVSAREHQGRRWIWIGLITFCLSIASMQIVQQVLYYTSYPKSVDIVIEHVDQLAFPSVAICNFNQYKRNAVNGTIFQGLLMQYQARGWPVPWEMYEPHLNNTNMTAILEKTGHNVSDSFIGSSFGQTRLNDHNFSRVITDFGQCFVFNTEEQYPEDLMIDAAGYTSGLHVTMDVDQDNYYYSEESRYNAGFFVYLFSKGTFPHVRDLGFSISPGFATQVGMDVRKVTNLPPPRGNCSDATMKYFQRYGYAECRMECATDYVVQMCGCKMAFMPGPFRECNPVEHLRCAIHQYEKTLEGENCSCPIPCSSMTYHPTISQAMHPSPFYAAYLQDLFRLRGVEIDDDYFTKNICQLDIYFRELTVKRVFEQPAYTFFGLMCDIGGSLGLWLGGSVLTIVEVFDLFGHAICIYTRITRRGKPTDGHGHRVVGSTLRARFGSTNDDIAAPKVSP
ncbi:acid-sensing ion channel 2-like [Lytechinus pictus]|uniref:acid-sensing ion channel 2-like n=1 Tax=Lytechinus pictus TaxID=7653 RepID=UPI0030BA22B2